MTEQRNQDGRFRPEHTDAEILAAVRTHEPAATSEVADEVDMTRQGADRRLRSLRDEGRVSSKKIGASLVWFAPHEDTSDA
jgi:predicted ArsR family transcriptional regulator